MKQVEKKSNTWLLASIIALVIIVVVIVLLYMMRSRRGREAVPAQMPPTATGPGMVGGAQGGTGVAPTPIAAPPPVSYAPPAPTVAVAPAAPVAARTAPAAVGTATGRFRVLNVKTQCTACNGPIERGANAYVCSCGTAIHEQCAGRLKICPGCNKEIRFG